MLPAGVGTASVDILYPPPVAGCHRAVPYTRLDELARRAMCHAEHNIRQNRPSSNHFQARAVSLLAAGALGGFGGMKHDEA